MENSNPDSTTSERSLPNIETSFDVQPEMDVENSSSAPTPVVAGVEENVNSRFIDYSIATPWEDLIASIERVLRSWKPYVSLSSAKAQQLDGFPSFSVNIDYNGTKMKLEFMDGCTPYCSEDIEHVKKQVLTQNKVHHYFYSEEIPLWFGMRKYVLLTRYNGSILGESERRLMFSALIGALDASQVQIPAFVSASPSSSIKHSLEVLGYMIMSPRQAEITLQSQDSVVTSGPKVVHFESQTLSNVGSKHPFFYLDGLMRLFSTKLWKFSRGNLSVSDESANVIVSAVEFYEFRCVSASRVRPTSPRVKLPPSTSSCVLHSSQLSSPVMKCTLDDFLICYPAHINNEDNGARILENEGGQEYSQAAHQNAMALLSSSQEYMQTKRADTPTSERNLSDSSGRGSDHSALLQAYNSAQGGAHPSTVTDVRKKLDYQLPLEKILVQVSFRDLKQGSVVDNDYYTTLLPSKLPPSAWAAKATFAPVKMPGKSRGISADILSPASVSPLFASSLRRLLALYVCGKSARSDSTFRTISDSLETYGNLQGCISTDRAIDISSVLSVESRRAVVFLCASASMRGTTASTSSQSTLHQDLLMRVFSRSLWIDESSNAGETNKTTDQKSDRPSWHWLSRLKKRGSDSANVSSSSPVGSWMSLVSVYMSSFETITSMVTFWQECIDEVRVHWENRVPIPRLYPPIPIMKSSPDVNKVNSDGDVCDDSKIGTGGVWLEPLWGDIIGKYRQSESPFDLPDLLQHLPHQKLQMINMCIICGDVANTAEKEIVSNCVSQAREGLASLLSQQSVHVDESGGESNERLRNDVDNSNGNQDIDADSLAAFLAMNVSSRDLSHITVPRLQRRLPMTSDALAQHRHLANKLRQGSSRSASESTMLKWQILYPELISDVRAFKSCNNTLNSTHSCNDVSDTSAKPVTFEDFVVWYGGAGVLQSRKTSSISQESLMSERGLDRISLDNLKNLWDECGEEGLSAPEQKPLFRAEQEAEKALGYLEGMTIVQIARTLLSSALPAVHMLLTHEVRRSHQELLERFQGTQDDLAGSVDDGPGLKTIFDPGQALSQDLDNIGLLIRSALHDLHLDTPLMGTTSSKVNSAGSSARVGGAGNKEETVNQQALLSIDAVCSAIADLEILLLKIESVATTLEYHPRLVGNIAKYGFVSAVTPAEAKIILSLAKCASFGQDSHTWHSFDGRELGIPKRKLFNVRCRSKNSLLNRTAQQVLQGEDNPTADSEGKDNSSPPLNNVSAVEDESWANVDYYQNQYESEGKHHQTSIGHREDLTQEHHQMTAVVEEGSLRVAFSLLEEDM